MCGITADSPSLTQSRQDIAEKRSIGRFSVSLSSDQIRHLHLKRSPSTPLPIAHAARSSSSSQFCAGAPTHETQECFANILRNKDLPPWASKNNRRVNSNIPVLEKRKLKPTNERIFVRGGSALSIRKQSWQDDLRGGFVSAPFNLSSEKEKKNKE
eukprot:GHVL01032232.1.p1 GENE.GHVL01032232.1~~GHVL01032232.1.p1  ORF type:complete len:156 (-),score=19.37 GHVL01032232.1:1421-1888(-)